MPIPQTCPGCGAAVSAVNADRGKCGWCGHPLEEVVELGEPDETPDPAPPAVPVAAPAEKAVPPASDVTLFDLTLVAVPEPAPAPKPARRQDTPTRPSRPGPPERPRPAAVRTRRQQVWSATRHEEDDDEEPRRRPEKKGGGKTVLIVGLVLAVLLVSCVGFGALGYWLYERSPDRVETPQTAREVVGARPAAQPTAPDRAKKPAWEKEWAALPAPDGFSVRLPVGAVGGPRTVTVDGEPLHGFRYAVEEGVVEYRVEWYDLPAELTLAPAGFVLKHRPTETPPAKYQSGPRFVPFAGGTAAELTFAGTAGQQETIRAVRYGPRVLMFAVRHDPGRLSAFAGLVPAEKQKEFFDSVRISYSPATPPPQAVFLKKKEQPPVTPPAAQPAVTLTSKATVFPHTASLLLKDGGLLAFARRGTSWLVHWYDVPSFRHAGQAVLPKPVSLAAVDEKAGRLYVATFAPGAGPDPRERLDAVGDVLAFDLTAVRSDSPAGTGLTPVGTFNLGAKVTALELAPDGKALYVVATYPPEGLPAKPKTKLLKLALPALTSAGEIELPVPVRGARLSPDGKHLFAFEHPFNLVGQPVFGTGATADVRVVDVAGWKMGRAVPVPGLVSDLRFVGDDRAVAVVITTNRPKLYALSAAGDPKDVTPTGGLKSLQAGYLGFSAGRLVTSARIPGTTGAEVLAVGPTGPPTSLGSESALGSAMLSGPVTVTPDGRYVVFASGSVAEVGGGK